MYLGTNIISNLTLGISLVSSLSAYSGTIASGSPRKPMEDRRRIGADGGSAGESAPLVKIIIITIQ